ncbi:MAG: FAD-dependent oxidoreductase [Planctomycetaceae bacterium]
MTSQSKHTLIVGGGVIGAFSALFLQKSGRQVTIVEKGEFGKGCSHGNCGYVSPSHVLPLTQPGQIMNGLKGILSSNRALRIHPRMSLSFWLWMLKFAARCNHRDMLQAGTSRHALLDRSAKLYREIISREKLNVEFRTEGLLFVYRELRGFEHYAATVELLREKFEVSADRVEGRDLTDMEPALKPGLAGAWHFRCDAHLRPNRLMAELKNLLTAAGVRIVENVQVLGFVSQDGSARSVRTPDREISADEFVVATGPLTPMLNSELGCRIPIQPGKGYSITMARPEICPKIPLILEECHVAITPFDAGYRIGSTMEFAGYNSELSRQRLQYLRTGAAQYLVEPTAEPVEEEWFGWRPMTWDGLPYVDRTPRYNNVWVAAGHNMLGISMGPATGELVTALVVGSKPGIDPHPLRIGR